MESKDLETLAERFWQGETTESEEESLRQAVLYGDIPQSLYELREYFQLTAEMREEEGLDEIFDKQIMYELEKRSTLSRSLFFFKIAAGIVVLLGLFFLVKQVNSDDIPPVSQEEIVIADTYEDPEVAYQEVKKALMMVSRKMNQGMSYTGGLGQFDKATAEIEKESSSMEGSPSIEKK